LQQFLQRIDHHARSTLIAPNMSPSAAVETCAAATRTQAAGTASSSRGRENGLTAPLPDPHRGTIGDAKLPASVCAFMRAVGATASCVF
jgi:hypothetical protein